MTTDDIRMHEDLWEQAFYRVWDRLESLDPIREWDDDGGVWERVREPAETRLSIITGAIKEHI